MHYKNIVAPVLLSLAVAAVLFIGCAAGNAERQDEAGQGQSRLAATLQDIGGAPAALAVSEPMRPFFAAGLGLVVLGGLVVCFGGKGTGFLLMALGIGTTATGVLFVQYPWAVLLLAAAAGAVAAFAAFDRWRTARRLAAASEELGRSREALEAAAEVIQNAPEGGAIKAGLSALGAEVEKKVRRVIDPIKEKLRAEGRIE